MRVLVIPEFYRRDDASANGTVNDVIAWMREWLTDGDRSGDVGPRDRREPQGGVAHGETRRHSHNRARRGRPHRQHVLDGRIRRLAELAEQSGPDNVLDEIIQPEDVSAAFMWLSSDDSRFVTGIALPVAAGSTAL